MNNDIFESAFSAIDDELIAEAKSPAIRIAAKRKKIIISSVAACVAAVLVAIPSIKILSDSDNNKITTSEETEIIVQQIIIEKEDDTSSKPQQESTDIPSEKEPTVSSKDDQSNIHVDYIGIDDTSIKMSDLYFIGTNTAASNGSTTSYEKVYSPNVEYLYINPIPDDKYVTIYKGNYEKEINQQEAISLADEFFPKIAKLLNTVTPGYTIHSNSTSISISDKFENSDYYGISIGVTNMLNRNIVNFSNFENPLTLDNKTFYIQKNQSDAEIINSLSELKIKLFDLFEVSFNDAKVIRHYDSIYDNYIVYLYDSGKHPLNKLQGDEPYTDYISIAFNDYDNKSNDTYYVSNIRYWSFRTENSSHSTPKAEMELLPLEKAEEYLSKGYVLATGGCVLCQSEQTPVDFANYDYVSFEYKGGFNVGVLAIPYYAFYKNIGTAENGNTIFAKTYVPAVEVQGYEEYFENKHANHSN